MRRLAHLALTSSIAALGLVAFPGNAPATSLPGPNGKIVFASGRANTDFPSPANGDDNHARIWVADYPGGTPVQVTSTSANVQDRHPSWSPDHTMIVYAEGTAFDPNGNYSIWIKDLVTGSQTQFLPAAPHQDHPVFSPDGTQIAYGSNGDIFVKGIAPGSQPVQLTNDADVEERPYWSADGSTIYYTRLVGTGNRDIYKKTPVTPSGVETDIVPGATDDWQPAASPDNRRLCFLRGPLNDNADLYTVNTDGTGVTAFSTTASVGDENCVWSPDGTRVLFTLGAFSAGQLMTKDANGNDPQTLDALNVANHFDGNSDWATNFPPTCDNKTVNIGVNQFTTIQLNCTDPDFSMGADPPTPATIDSVFMDVAKPAKGNIGNLSDDRKVIYTPPAGFKGTDTFTYTGNDGVSTSSPGTITIHVGTNPNGTIDTKAPRFSSVRLSAKRWRRGPGLPRIAKAKVGTTISFKLDEAGRVTIGFQRVRAGQRVGRRCVKPMPGNRSRRPCKRFVRAGSIPAFAGKVGLNKVRFQGRLTRSRRLGLGTYRVVLSVVDSAANRSTRNGPTFTIVAR
jgi:dipeptidyl aminopeptidase/acylaminoacyl peptidase